MELMSFKTKKAASSLKVDSKLPKSPLLQKKHLPQTWWGCWRKDDSRNSLKPFKIMNKEIQKPTKELTAANKQRSCSKNSAYRQTLLILLDTLSLFTQTKNSWNCQPDKLLRRFNFMLTQWEDTEPHPSFILFTVSVESLKDFQESVPWTVEPLCLTLTSMKFFSKTVKS